MNSHLIRDIECALCEKVFECKGKEDSKPCLYFKERKDNELQTNQSNRREK